MATKIVFGDGVAVTVEAPMQEVRKRLSEDKLRHGEPFTQFTTIRGRSICVAGDRVAYLVEGRKSSVSGSGD